MGVAVAPTIVVVVVQSEKVFHGQVAGFDAVRFPQVALNLFPPRSPVAVDVPAGPGDSRDSP